MKFSKILAAAAAMTMIASVAVPVSAASEDYMYTVKKSWTGKAPADQEETTIKWTEDVAKGATDLNKWDSGTTKYNGQWAQVVLTSDDLSGITIDFTIDMDDATQVEWHVTDPEKPDEDSYQVFLALAGEKVFTETHESINEGLGEHEDSEFVSVGNKSFTYTITGDDIKAAVDNGNAELNANDDNVTYTLGFNIQVGHFTNAKVTALVKDSNGNLYEGAVGENSSQAPGGETSSSKKEDDSSKSTTSSTAGSTGTTKTTGTGTAAATGTTDATDTQAATGATAGLVFAGIALAGAAVVVTKRK